MAIADMVEPYVKKWNAISEQHKTKEILKKIVPSIEVHLSDHVLPLLSPLGFDLHGLCLLLVSIIIGIGGIIAILLGLLKFFIELISMILVSRRTIIALSTNAKETKVYLIYFLFFGILNVLQTSALSVFLSAIPFYNLVKSAFLFFCSTPESGFALYLYNSFIKPYLGNSSESIKSKEDEPDVPKLCCNVQGYETNIQDDGEPYVVVQFSGDSVKYVTSLKKSDVLKLPLPETYPSKTGSLTFTLKSKHQFGSDITIGVSAYELEASYVSPKVFDLKLFKSLETENKTPTGTLTVEISI